MKPPEGAVRRTAPTAKSVSLLAALTASSSSAAPRTGTLGRGSALTASVIACRQPGWTLASLPASGR
jgi:hypothetical protein